MSMCFVVVILSYFIFLFSLLFSSYFIFFFFNNPTTTEIYTLSLHDALPIWPGGQLLGHRRWRQRRRDGGRPRGHQLRHRSEEHTSELQSPDHLVCRLLLEKKKKKK